MRIRTKHLRTALVAVVAVASTVACTSGGTEPANPDPADGTAAPRAQQDSGAEQRRVGRAEGAIALGDLNKPKTAKEVGAPFDPCALDWTDFPAEVRPTDGRAHAPTQQRPGPEEKWELICKYDNSGAIQVDVKAGTSTGPEGGYFLVHVVWQRDGTADPARKPGSTVKTWNGKSGYVLPSPDDPKLGKLCMSAVKLSTGAGAAMISNSRFPQKSACDVADALAAAIAAKST